MFRRSIIIVMSLVLVLSSAMIKPVEAKNKTKYSIQMSKKSYGMGYTHRIKFGKKKITVWGAIYSYKKNKVLKYKKRIFKTNKKTKYGAYGYDARGKARFLEDKKTFMDVIKSYTKRNGIVKVKNGISVDLVYKNKKLTQVMLVS